MKRMKSAREKEQKINWKKIFAILILLLFIGTILAVVLVNIDKILILGKTP